MAPHSNKKAKECRLLDLPMELRLQIYHLALDGGNDGIQLAKRISFPEGHLRMRISPQDKDGYKKGLTSLVRTNRQIRHEALPFLYPNRFIFDRESCPEALSIMGPPRIALLRDTEIDYGSSDGLSSFRETFRLLAHAIGLGTFKIQQPYWI